ATQHWSSPRAGERRISWHSLRTRFNEARRRTRTRPRQHAGERNHDASALHRRPPRIIGNLHDANEPARFPSSAYLRWQEAHRHGLATRHHAAWPQRKDHEVRMMRAYIHSTPDM